MFKYTTQKPDSARNGQFQHIAFKVKFVIRNQIVNGSMIYKNLMTKLYTLKVIKTPKYKKKKLMRDQHNKRDEMFH